MLVAPRQIWPDDTSAWSMFRLFVRRLIGLSALFVVSYENHGRVVVVSECEIGKWYTVIIDIESITERVY